MVGRIFSIEEFSTFDGPGMRCTIFMKGCPLKCQWCHNPEGQRFEAEILRSPNGCIGCGTCERTGMCLESIPLCPQHLLRLCGEELTPQALVDRLSTKLDMLALVGGGITFSGGEPLSQADFVLECLKLLKGRAHRAVQTSGFCPMHTFREVLQNTDYILFDLKHLDSKIHKLYTGVGNEQILSNYHALVESGVPFITRIPLIPGVNDTESNITATAQLLQSLDVHEIELLPYNKAAGAKYKAVRREYTVSFDPTQEPKNHISIFENHEIEVRVL